MADQELVRLLTQMAARIQELQRRLDRLERIEIGPTSGSAAGAPSGAQYLTLATNATLTNERVLTAGSGLSSTDNGANGNFYFDVGAGPGVGVTATTVYAVAADISGSLVEATIAGSLNDNYGPASGTYLTVTAHGDLTNERQISAGSGLTLTDAGAGASVFLDVGAGPGLGLTADTVFAVASDITGSLVEATIAASLADNFQALDADLTAIAALSGCGLAARTAADTWALRAVSGSANFIEVTNGDGIAGNPTVTTGSSVYQVGGQDVAVADGGTGLSTSPSSGTLLIGQAANTWTVSTLTGGSNVSISNGDGAITINVSSSAATAPGGSASQVQYNNSGAFGGAACLLYASNGFVGIGTTTVASATLHVRNTSTAASPTLRLDQYDYDKPFIRLHGSTSGANIYDNSQVTEGTLNYQGLFQVMVTDDNDLLGPGFSGSIYYIPLYTFDV